MEAAGSLHDPWPVAMARGDGGMDRHLWSRGKDLTFIRPSELSQSVAVVLWCINMS